VQDILLLCPTLQPRSPWCNK